MNKIYFFNLCLQIIFLIILAKSEAFNIRHLKKESPLNFVEEQENSFPPPKSEQQKLSIIYLPEEEIDNSGDEILIKNNSDQLNKRTAQERSTEIFTRMRSICARMPRLKRKRTPKPGSPESLVAFLCSSANIF
ncbi:unnamed protein product [Meloidogyne enterolobii]|uniref:Uncharacterized protein n=2 Tax=Meloidogyne enterolobii TaxID=390850 RepID=A0A6V7V804_MELEN|nr:unnamed protein product [Meloidogyne enterolobii]